MSTARFVEAVVLVGGGAALVVWGFAAATARRRPLDLVGALAAGAGVLVAAVGATVLVVRGLLD